MIALSAAFCFPGPEEGRGNKSTHRQCAARGEILSISDLTSEDANELRVSQEGRWTFLAANYD